MKKLHNLFRRSQQPSPHRNLALVSLAFFTWGIGEGLFFYFQPIYLQELGATPVVIGAILGLNGLAMTLVQTPAGYLADRIGNKNVMILAWCIGTSATVVMAFSKSLVGFSIGWIVYGVSAMSAATNSYITDQRGEMSVGRALTTVSALYHLGAFIGPMIGGQVGEKLGLQIIYRLAIIFFVISSLVILFIQRDRAKPAAQNAYQQNLLRFRPFSILLSVSFISIFAGYLAEPLTPNFLQQAHQLSLSQIGQLGSIGSLGNAIISLAFGGLRPFLGIMLGHGFLAVFSLIIWQGKGMPVFAIAFFLRGGYRIFQAMYMSIGRSLISRQELGMIYGLMATVNSLAIILAPPVSGFIYDISPGLIYPVSLTLLGITFLINFALSRAFSKNKPEEPLTGELT